MVCKKGSLSAEQTSRYESLAAARQIVEVRREKQKLVAVFLTNFQNHSIYVFSVPVEVRICTRSDGRHSYTFSKLKDVTLLAAT